MHLPLTLYQIRCVRHSLERYAIHLLPVFHICCNEIAMEDKATHSLRCTETLLSANSLVPLTPYWSLNEIIIQNKCSITYCLFAMWMRLTTSALIASLTVCFSCSHLTNKWWYNLHTSCWPSDKMRLVWTRTCAVSLLTSCKQLAQQHVILWWY